MISYCNHYLYYIFLCYEVKVDVGSNSDEQDAYDATEEAADDALDEEDANDDERKDRCIIDEILHELLFLE